MTCPPRSSPSWPDQGALAAATAELATYPPLVFAGECDDLKAGSAAAARGEAFFLQGGDCAETFADATADDIRNKIKTMLQMAVVLTYGARSRRQGRPDGRASSPSRAAGRGRSATASSCPAYRGDAVNDYAFDPGRPHPRPAAGCCGPTTPAARR